MCYQINHVQHSLSSHFKLPLYYIISLVHYPHAITWLAGSALVAICIMPPIINQLLSKCKCMTKSVIHMKEGTTQNSPLTTPGPRLGILVVTSNTSTVSLCQKIQQEPGTIQLPSLCTRRIQPQIVHVQKRCPTRYGTPWYRKYKNRLGGLLQDGKTSPLEYTLYLILLP